MTTAQGAGGAPRAADGYSLPLQVEAIVLIVRGRKVLSPPFSTMSPDSSTVWFT